MNKEEQKTILSKLLKASQEIDRTPKASYIDLSEEFIQKQADEKGITFDEMIEIIENELKQ